MKIILFVISLPIVKTEYYKMILVNLKNRVRLKSMLFLEKFLLTNLLLEITHWVLRSKKKINWSPIVSNFFNGTIRWRFHWITMRLRIWMSTIHSYPVLMIRFISRIYRLPCLFQLHWKFRFRKIKLLWKTFRTWSNTSLHFWLEGSKQSCRCLGSLHGWS